VLGVYAGTENQTGLDLYGAISDDSASQTISPVYG
jgi:hypothetical protein